MKAIAFKGQNIVFAKNQKEYAELPSCAQNNGIASFCFSLSDGEIKRVKESGVFFVTRLTFGGPVQPIKVMFKTPNFPVDHKNFTSTVKEWGPGMNQEAVFEVQVSKVEMMSLETKKCIWVSTATYGSPLQPFMMTADFPQFGIGEPTKEEIEEKVRKQKIADEEFRKANQEKVNSVIGNKPMGGKKIVLPSKKGDGEN